MINFIIKLLPLLVFFISTGCVAKPLMLERIQLYGRMNQANVKIMQDEIDEKRKLGYNKKFLLVITSDGGDAESLFSLMELFKSNVSHIFIGTKCISSCAELVSGLDLPILMGDKSVIGFHNGPTLDFKLAQSVDLKDSNCHKKRYDNYQKFVKFNIEKADKIKAESLGIFDVKLGKMSQNCQEILIGMKNKLWFPNTDQLRQIYGLKIVGQTPCSDRQDCLNRVVEKWWGKGVRYRMGSTDLLS
jgi:hypothetical protein